MWRRKHNRRSSVSAACLPRLIMPLVGVSPLGSFFVSFLAPPLGPSCLLVLYGPAALIGSSSHPLAFPSAACFLLIGSSARPLPRIARLPAPFDKLDGAGMDRRRSSTRMADGDGYGWRTDGGGLLTCSWDGGGWRMADGGRGGCCLLVLGMAMGWIGSCVSLSLSSAHQIDEGHGYDSSSHRRGGAFFFFSPDPLPPALLGLLALACSPVPGRGMCGPVSWLAAAGVRAACLRSHLSFRSLAVARSLVAIRSVSIVPLVPDWGVVGRFMGYSARYLVGVGVPQNMPLNGILWLLTGIFGDGVRSYFSALPVASFSPICHALRPLSAAVSWRSCGRFPAVSWRKRRVCVLSCLGSFSASHVMGRMASRTGCRAGWMAPAGRLACLYRFALPLPLGAGDYVRSAVIGSACGEGVGDIVEVLLSISSSSFHLFIAVVIVSPCLLRCLRRLILVSPCLLRHPVLVVSSSPRCHRLCLAACVRSCPLCSRMGFLSLLSPFLRLAGRGVLCLLAHALWLSFPSPCSLVSCLPAFACHRGSPPRRLVSCGCSSCLSSRRVSSVPSCSSCLPVLRQAWAGSVSARCCLLAFVLVVRAAAGVGGIASAGLVCCLFASDGWRAMRCCRLWLCRVCVVVVCIYKLNACSCIMDIVERKRTRKDFDDE